MASFQQEKHTEGMREALSRHRDALLAIRNCTGLGITRKEVCGKKTDILSITVFVSKKSVHVAAAQKVPQEIDGFPTDVVEWNPIVELDAGAEQGQQAPLVTSTDPYSRHNPMFSGLSIAAEANPQRCGTICCFLEEVDAEPEPDHEIYMLTAHHVLTPSAAGDFVLQPGGRNPPRLEDRCGRYFVGCSSPSLDCALVRATRPAENEVPNYPQHWGNRNIAGFATARDGTGVYKYGITTNFTQGRVEAIDLTLISPPGEVMLEYCYLITGTEDSQGSTDPGHWCAHGDSGAAVIRKDNDRIIGIHVAVAREAKTGRWLGGLALEIRPQLTALSQQGGIGNLQLS